MRFFGAKGIPYAQNLSYIQNLRLLFGFISQLEHKLQRKVHVCVALAGGLTPRAFYTCLGWNVAKIMRHFYGNVHVIMLKRITGFLTMPNQREKKLFLLY